MAQIEIRPEMCGKVIDESHFKFHVECKAKILSAFNRMKSGLDFLKTLSKQNFSTNKDWLKNSCNDPNVKVLIEIIEDYKQAEHRPSRAKILIPLMEYAVALYASDLFYRERGEWFMFQLIRRSPSMRFTSVFIDPNNWYPKTRNIMRNPDGSIAGDLNDLEQDPNAPTVEQEYMKWYGIDVTKDIEDLDPELRNRIISENQKWLKDSGLKFERA